VLAENVEALREAGLRRVTISLDTLRRERFVAIARRDLLHRVLGGLEAARAAGFTGLGINCVVMRGLNDDEVPDLVELGRRLGAEVRFIEYMDVGGATRWDASRVVGRDEIIELVAAKLGPVRTLPRTDSSPASRFELDDGTRFGVIAPMSAPFCRSCDRARLTSDGQFFTCLYATRGLDLRTPLRAGATRGDLAAMLDRTWSGRSDRGAEARAELTLRGPLADRAALAADPHLEMHARGG
jgi:GTP 3',8-cyclase